MGLQDKLVVEYCSLGQ